MLQKRIPKRTLKKEHCNPSQRTGNQNYMDHLQKEKPRTNNGMKCARSALALLALFAFLLLSLCSPFGLPLFSEACACAPFLLTLFVCFWGPPVALSRPSWNPPGLSWGLFGPSWALLALSWGPLMALLAPFGALLGPSWRPLGLSRGPLGALLL